jgi:hypothetical protein
MTALKPQYALCFLLAGTCLYTHSAQLRPTDTRADSPVAVRAKRPVTVADAIEMTKSGDNSYLDDLPESNSVGLFSPDNRRFAFITQKGDLKKDVVAYSIWVFETADALTTPEPRLVATLASSSNRPAISHLKWLPDNDTLVFLGEQPGEKPQVYKVRSSTGKLEKLTDQATTIAAFSVSDAGDAFVYLAEIPTQPMFSEEMRQHGFVVTTGHTWEDLYLNKREFDTRYDLYVKTALMGHPQQVGDTLRVDADASFLTISPNGAYAFFQGYNIAPPTVWDDYEFTSDGDVTFLRSACLAGTIERCAEQYFLVDLQKRTVEPLINAPTEIKYQGVELATWTVDNTILLVNALLPLDSVSAEERSQRQRRVYAAEITVPDREIHVINEREKVLPAYSIEPDGPNRRVVVKPSQAIDGPPHEFRKTGGRWQDSEISLSAAEPTLPLAVKLDEDINTPPKLVATDPKTKKKKVLLDLNPQFADLTFARVEVFQWKNRQGRPSGGQLYYPTNYVAGKRYPLVIQTHGETRERFWIDGPFSTTNAAQALANKEFFVLQMGYGDRYDKASLEEILKLVDGPEEGPYFVSFVESAIDELDRRGLIDRNHIGLSGFSRTVFEGEYLLTHSSYRIGAAVMADGVDYGYAGCVYFFAPGFTANCEKMNGGVPWGDSLANWVKQAPPMRLDKIHTPILLQSITAPLGEWEIYAGLQWLKKPVELENFYPEGEHVLVKPHQKLLSEQTAVDWYSFWLKNEEDPDTAKAEQYKRWRELRKLNEKDRESAVASTQH